MSMEQDKRTVPGLSEGVGQGGEVPAREMAGYENPPHGDASPEQEDASAADSGGHGDAAAESDEDPPRGDASPEKKDASPADSVGHSEAAAESHDDQPHGDSSSDQEDASAADSGGHGDAAAESDEEEYPKNQLATCLRFRAAIAHPTPPTTYRRTPVRGRKQYNPTRFVAVGVAPATARSAGVYAMPTADQGDMNEAQGSTVTHSESDSDASVDSSSSDDGKSGTDATNAAAAASSLAPSSYRPASRSRKQRRPDHFIPEEAEAAARGKARRSNAVLDRFLTSLLLVSREQSPEWVRNVTADDDRGQGQPEEEPDGRARFLTVIAILGASIALCIVSCVLFYIVGKRTEHGRHK